MENKLKLLQEALRGLGSAVVAFSGGVDSTFLLKVAVDTLGPGRTLAVTARSSTYPQSELDEATSLARQIGAEHRVIVSEELDIEGFSQNPANRCYYCKGELFGKLSQIAQAEGYAAVLDGANADDAGDYRPGSDAAREKEVRSLLAENGFSKDEIRALSKRMGLPTWDKPAFACLASRFPYGHTIDREKLGMVEKAERFLRELGFRQLRVRHHGDMARIEVEKDDIQKIAAPETAGRIYSEFKKIGFLYVTVDLAGYRTGSMNEALPLAESKRG